MMQSLFGIRLDRVYVATNHGNDTCFQIGSVMGIADDVFVLV